MITIVLYIERWKGEILLDSKEILPIHFNSYGLDGLDVLKANPIKAVEIIMNTYGNDVKNLFIPTYIMKRIQMM